MADFAPLIKDSNGFYRQLATGENLLMDSTQKSAIAAPHFTDLGDVPTSYTGQALLVVRVNATEDALEFAAGGGGSGLTQPQVMARCLGC